MIVVLYITGIRHHQHAVVSPRSVSDADFAIVECAQPLWAWSCTCVRRETGRLIHFFITIVMYSPISTIATAISYS